VPGALPGARGTGRFGREEGGGLESLPRNPILTTRRYPPFTGRSLGNLAPAPFRRCPRPRFTARSPCIRRAIRKPETGNILELFRQDPRNADYPYRPSAPRRFARRAAPPPPFPDRHAGDPALRSRHRARRGPRSARLICPGMGIVKRSMPQDRIAPPSVIGKTSPPIGQAGASIRTVLTLAPAPPHCMHFTRRTGQPAAPGFAISAPRAHMRPCYSRKLNGHWRFAAPLSFYSPPQHEGSRHPGSRQKKESSA
jgi:hypothetical protein